MSLLDDVSIVVTPNGYKAGELYAVLPVPTEGAELVTNGDFATDSDWTKTAGVSISGGFANFTSGQDNFVFQDIMVIGKRYIMSLNYNITSLTGSAYFGSNGGSGNAILSMAGLSGSGTLSGEITASDTKLIVRSSSFNGTITNVSVKEYTAADMDVTRATAATRVDEAGLVNYAEILGSKEDIGGSFPLPNTNWTLSGFTIADNKLHCVSDGTYYNAIQSNVFEVGKTYQITFDITGWTLGNIRVRPSGQSPFQKAGANGSYTFYYTATNHQLAIERNTACDMYLENLSVKEVTRDNVPRIDYTGGGCPHILAEPQRTNLISLSIDYSTTYWSQQTGIVPTYNTTETLSPDGTYNATKFIGTGSTGVFKASISVSGIISRSVYLKSVTGTINVILKDPNVAVTSKSLTVTTEWQRFELNESNGTSLQGLWIDDIPVSGIYMWGAQIESGSFPTSYIPTSGSTVTRNQDQFTRDGIGSLINSTEGVLFVEMAALSNEALYREISLSDGTTNNVVEIRYTPIANQIQFVVRNAGAAEVVTTITLSNALDFNKIAFSFKSNDYKMYVNGSEVGTDLSGTMPSGLNTLSLDWAGNNKLFGKVKQLQVYKTALTDEQLIQLTGESGTDFYESYAEMASALTYTIQ